MSAGGTCSIRGRVSECGGVAAGGGAAAIPTAERPPRWPLTLALFAKPINYTSQIYEGYQPPASHYYAP